MTKTDARELVKRLWDATLRDDTGHLNKWDSGLWVRFKLVTAVIDAYVEESEDNDDDE